MLTARAENLLRGRNDMADTIRRLQVACVERMARTAEIRRNFEQGAGPISQGG